MGGLGEVQRDERAEAKPDHVVRHVYVENVVLLFELINDRLAPVFTANRYFEEHTGIANKAGTNNLTEALSHIGTLVEHAHEMSRDEQREQVVHFGDHLRRSMMESFEQVVKARIGKIKDQGLWDRFNREVVPLLRAGKLPNAPTEEEVLTFARQMNRQLEDGRELKREHRWEDWDNGAKHLADACDSSNELVAKLRQGIGAAEQYRDSKKGLRLDRRGYIVGVLGLAVGIVAVVLAVALA